MSNKSMPIEEPMKGPIGEPMISPIEEPMVSPAERSMPGAQGSAPHGDRQFAAASAAQLAEPCEEAGVAGHGPHLDAHEHHHHTHAANSAHPGHHHLLTVEHLSVSFSMYDSQEPFFKAAKRDIRVIDDLSVSVHAGEVVAVVGASGSGKTLLADAVMGLFEPNVTVRGTIWFDGKQQDAQSLAALRGHGISYVPQSAGCLDPMMRVVDQVAGFGPGAGKRSVRKARARELLQRYGLNADAARMYPHQLSGGMARRVLLCCALMDNPKLIVADEPTPGLDDRLAQQVMDDLRAFANDGGGVLLITHDIELALSCADRIAVFKDATVVEETSVESFASPDTLRHPFSRALWHALPQHDFAAPAASGEESVCAQA